MPFRTYVPLLFVVTLLLPILLVNVSKRVERTISHISLVIFRGYVEDRPNRINMERKLLQAHEDTVYRLYASKTLLYTIVIALTFTVLGVYVLTGSYTAIVSFVEQLPPDVYEDLAVVLDPLVDPGLTSMQQFVLVVISSSGFGLASGILTLKIRWFILENRADNRRRQIDMGMVHAISLMYALSKGGVSFPKVMKTLANNEAVYGEVAREFQVAVREMDLFGLDMFTVVDRMAERTPSRRFAEFAKNLSTSIEGGRKIPEFLQDQYESHYDDLEERQEMFLESLAGLSEGYVGLLVAGPLFLVTILVVIGLVMGDTAILLGAIIYIFIPLLTLGFMVYLSTVMGALNTRRAPTHVSEEFKSLKGIRLAEREPGEESLANVERLTIHRTLRRALTYLSHPFRTLYERPTRTLYITVPIAIIYVSYRAWIAFQTGDLTPAAIDDTLVHAALLMLLVFAVFQESRRRKIYSIESVTPAFLDQLASINEAGRTLADSIGRVSEAEVGPLAPEVRRAWRDIEWHGNAVNALRRMETRIRTEGFTRIVVLLTQAMKATGDLQQVLRIAADDAEAHYRLKKRSRERTFTYLIVVYISFLVFLGIIAVLQMVFIPNIPVSDIGTVGSATTGTYSLSPKSRDQYVLLLFHAALVQATCSGLVAGQIGERSVKNGAKHATILLGMAYLLLIFIS